MLNSEFHVITIVCAIFCLQCDTTVALFDFILLIMVSFPKGCLVFGGQYQPLLEMLIIELSPQGKVQTLSEVVLPLHNGT